MVRFEDTVLCDGCGVEIFWSPVVEGSKVYCCDDCRQFGVCDCRNRQDLVDEEWEDNIPVISPLIGDDYDV